MRRTFVIRSRHEIKEPPWAKWLRGFFDLMNYLEFVAGLESYQLQHATCRHITG